MLSSRWRAGAARLAATARAGLRNEPLGEEPGGRGQMPSCQTLIPPASIATCGRTGTHWPRGGAMLSTIIAAIDGSDPARRATAFAGDLAGRYGARLILIHVRTREPLSNELRDL